MASEVYDKARNERFLSMLTDPGQEKTAQNAVTDYIRDRVREDGFWRKLIPMVKAQPSDFSKRVHTDKPVIVCEKEPGSPAAITAPFGTLPLSEYIQAPRFEVTFERIMTPRYVKDIIELMTYHMDIRQILSDNSLKDILTEEDTKSIVMYNEAMGGAADVTATNSGIVQWKTMGGGIDRDALEDAFTILPKTPSSLEVAKVLCNNVTIREIMKFGRDEMGGDFSERLMRDGWVDEKFMGVDWIITIKRTLVPDNSIYMFSTPEFQGKSFSLDDTVMYVKSEAFMVEFFAYEAIGGALGNTNCVARADFE